MLKTEYLSQVKDKYTWQDFDLYPCLFRIIPGRPMYRRSPSQPAHLGYQMYIGVMPELEKDVKANLVRNVHKIKNHITRFTNVHLFLNSTWSLSCILGRGFVMRPN